ncbi:MAG TPA: glycoside hydrolase family 3 N-terminal domain-containing protein, partial [bacterium]
YDRNVKSPEQVKALCAEVSQLGSHPIILVDQEGGKVRRLKDKLGFVPLPSAEAFAALSAEERLRTARASYAQLVDLGIHYNLAPVVDLNLNPTNPDIGIHQRSYSADPAVVNACVEAVNTVAKEVNLGLCLKHYPGLGGARTDSHNDLTDLSATIRDDQLALFYDWGTRIHGEAVLVSHGIVRQWGGDQPITVSKVGLANLRKRLPNALLMSDDLQMQGLQKVMPTAEALPVCLGAGLDLMLIGNNVMDEEPTAIRLTEKLESAVAADPVLAANLAASSARVQDRKRRLAR